MSQRRVGDIRERLLENAYSRLLRAIYFIPGPDEEVDVTLDLFHRGDRVVDQGPRRVTGVVTVATERLVRSGQFSAGHARILLRRIVCRIPMQVGDVPKIANVRVAAAAGVHPGTCIKVHNSGLSCVYTSSCSIYIYI